MVNILVINQIVFIHTIIGLWSGYIKPMSMMELRGMLAVFVITSHITDQILYIIKGNGISMKLAVC